MGIRIGLVGLGKMGISHLAISNSHLGVKVVGVCDSNPALLAVLRKNTPFHCYQNPADLIGSGELDGVIISTPSRSHGDLVKLALDNNLHVFCEKPFCLDPRQGEALAAEAKRRSLVGQVGYHFRFVGTFQKARELVRAGILGRVHHIRAEAYGPVVLRPRGTTWRVQRSEGGGCLYDYASHAVDIVNFLYETPSAVSGTIARPIFSRDVEDEVYSTLLFPSGASGQLAANWSDEGHRKMSVKVTIWGSEGKMSVDRQELQLYLRRPNESYQDGWHIENITELTDPVSYYLRGEEYSAQFDHFAQCIEGKAECRSSFSSAVEADTIIQMLVDDAEIGRQSEPMRPAVQAGSRQTFFRAIKDRVTSRS